MLVYICVPCYKGKTDEEKQQIDTTIYDLSDSVIKAGDTPVLPYCRCPKNCVSYDCTKLNLELLARCDELLVSDDAFNNCSISSKEYRYMSYAKSVKIPVHSESEIIQKRDHSFDDQLEFLNYKLMNFYREANKIFSEGKQRALSALGNIGFIYRVVDCVIDISNQIGIKFDINFLGFEKRESIKYGEIGNLDEFDLSINDFIMNLLMFLVYAKKRW
jgi:hypothetical protein